MTNNMSPFISGFTDELIRLNADAFTKESAEESLADKAKGVINRAGKGLVAGGKGLVEQSKDRAAAYTKGLKAGKGNPPGYIARTVDRAVDTATELPGAVVRGTARAAKGAAGATGGTLGYVGEKMSDAAKSDVGKYALGAGVLGLLGRKAWKAL